MRLHWDTIDEQDENVTPFMYIIISLFVIPSNVILRMSYNIVSVDIKRIYFLCNSYNNNKKKYITI